MPVGRPLQPGVKNGMSDLTPAWLPRVPSACGFLAGLVLCLAGALAAAPTQAQDDPPGRVGRLADLQGKVSWFDHEEGNWSEAERNRPLTSGDRLSTGPQGRAELRIGSTVLRLAGGTELEVLRLDDEHMSFQLHTGSLALRVRSREVASDIELLTTEARLRPERAGHYRVDRVDDTTQAGVWRGLLRIDDAQGFLLEADQRVELWRESRDGRDRRSLRFAWTRLPDDAFAAWAARDDQRDERSASNKYVSPEMTGAEELDRHGRWERHPEYGVIWFPLEVSSGWAPYRYGRWAWVRPWGWTWVDDAPWGFAPFHYGRWVSWRGRWGWFPGDYVARPVYSPALVAWVGGSQGSVSISVGGPSVGWVPLAPRDWYVPHYRHTPIYVERVNPRPPGQGNQPGWHRPPQQVPTGPVMYGNQGVPGAVTVVPRDVLLQRQPVARGAIDTRVWVGSMAQQPMQALPPPSRDNLGPRRERPREEPRIELRDGPRPLVPAAPAEQPVRVMPAPLYGPVIDLRRTSPQPEVVRPGPRERADEREREREIDRERGGRPWVRNPEAPQPMRTSPGPVAAPSPPAAPTLAPPRPAPQALPPVPAPAPQPAAAPPVRPAAVLPPTARPPVREGAERGGDDERKRGPQREAPRELQR